MYKYKSTILFISVLILACILRYYNLSQTPNGFHADEASFYINAQSIAQTGKDEDGNRHPLSIQSFIDPKPALYSYFQIPFITTMGNQIAASRMPSMLFGVASIAVIYGLLAILSTRQVALFSSAVLAISPWHIMISRGTQEVISSFFFLLLALYLLLLALKTKSYTKLKIIGFTFCAFLSMYFYHSAKIVLPLMVIGLLTFYYKKSKAFLLDATILLFLTVVAISASLFVQESVSRASAVGILTDKKPQAKLIEQIYGLHEEIPITTTRIFYNKAQAYLFAVTNEYLSYFSPEFLFIEGGKPLRYRVPDHGLLFLVEIPFIAIGLYFAIAKKRKEWPLFIGILLISPLPAALTTLETPSIIRSFPMVLGFSYFVAVALTELISMKQKYIKIILFVTLGVIYLWQIGYFSLQYHIQAKYNQPWYRNSPYTEIAQAVAPLANEYESIQVTNDLRPLYAYFVMENLIDIQTLQANPLGRNQNEYTLGKFVFNRDVCEFSEYKPGVLYIAESGCANKNEKIKNLEVIKTISYTDDVAVYVLLQVSQ